MKALFIGLVALVLLADNHKYAWAQSPSDTLAIVVNKANPIEEISSVDLRKIFLGQRSNWDKGGAITIAMRDTGQTERLTILQQVCHMTESEFNRYFLQATFTGQVQAPPKRFATAAGVREFVAALPGAIGYLRINEVNGAVKVLRVNGRLPRDPGYELPVQAP